MLREAESLVVELCADAEGEEQGGDSGFSREHRSNLLQTMSSPDVHKQRNTKALSATDMPPAIVYLWPRQTTHIAPPPSRVRLGAPDAEESGDSLCDSLASETGKNIR